MSDDHYEEEVRSCLDLQLVNGRYSLGLVGQLARMIAGRSGYVHLIYNEIALLESALHARVTATKPAEPLQGLLAGLHHKHYFQPSFIGQNLANFAESPRFDKMYSRVMRDSSIPDDRKLDTVVYRATITAHEQRSNAKKLTGEWIIYKKFRQKNHYLTLATHAERHEQILGRVVACRDEFPELELERLLRP